MSQVARRLDLSYARVGQIRDYAIRSRERNILLQQENDRDLAMALNDLRALRMVPFLLPDEEDPV